MGLWDMSTCRSILQNTRNSPLPGGKRTLILVVPGMSRRCPPDSRSNRRFPRCPGGPFRNVAAYLNLQALTKAEATQATNPAPGSTGGPAPLVGEACLDEGNVAGAAGMIMLRNSTAACLASINAWLRVVHASVTASFPAQSGGTGSNAARLDVCLPWGGAESLKPRPMSTAGFQKGCCCFRSGR